MSNNPGQLTRLSVPAIFMLWILSATCFCNGRSRNIFSLTTLFSKLNGLFAATGLAQMANRMEWHTATIPNLSPRVHTASTAWNDFFHNTLKTGMNKTNSIVAKAFAGAGLIFMLSCKPNGDGNSTDAANKIGEGVTDSTRLPGNFKDTGTLPNASGIDTLPSN